jgi:hypothetical protein
MKMDATPYLVLGGSSDNRRRPNFAPYFVRHAYNGNLGDLDDGLILFPISAG